MRWIAPVVRVQNGAGVFPKRVLTAVVAVVVAIAGVQLPVVAPVAAAPVQQSQGSAEEERRPTPPAVKTRPVRGFEEGKSQLDPSRTSELRREWRNPDGTRTVELHSRPVRFRDGRGRWTEIDLALEDKADGRMAARAAARSARLSKRATADAVVLDGDFGPLVFRHPDATGVPAVVEGRVARYPRGLSGNRDLVVGLTVSGFEESVVVPDRSGASSYRVDVDFPGPLSARQGVLGVEFVHGDRVVASFGGGIGFDSAGPVPAEEPVFTRLVEVRGKRAQIEVGVDRAWFDDPARVFPVTIDPYATYRSTAYNFNACAAAGGDSFSMCDTYVNSDSYDSAYSGQTQLRTGSPGFTDQQDGGKNRTRTYIQWPTDNFGTYCPACSPPIDFQYDVRSVEFRLYTYGGSTTSGTTNLSGAAQAPSRNTTWRNQPGRDVWGVAKSVSYAGGQGYVYFSESVPESATTPTPTKPPLVALAQRWFNSYTNNRGIVLEAANERDPALFRQYYSGEYGALGPRLTITYNRPVPATTLLSPADQSATATTTPTFQAAAVTDPDVNTSGQTPNGDVPWYDFRVFDATGAQVATSSWQTGTSWAPPAGALRDGNQYRVEVWTHDRIHRRASGPSPQVHFDVDTSPPGAPTILSATHPYVDAQPGWSNSNDPTFSWSASDTSGIANYSYRLDRSATAPVDEDPEPFATSQTFPDVADGVWYLRVRAQNRAGLWGPIATYAIQVDTVAPTPPVNLRSPSHPLGTASSQDQVTMRWDPGADDRSGVAGYSWVFQQSPTWVDDRDNQIDGDAASRGTESDPLNEGDPWYFHMVTVDRAGNTSLTATYGPIFIDQGAPADPVDLARTLNPDLVGQSDELGLEQFLPYNSSDLGSGTAYVQLRTGNLVATFDDATIPGQGLNTIIRRTYNAQRAAEDQHDNGLGLGWSLSVGDTDAGLEGLADADGAVTDIDIHGTIAAAATRRLAESGATVAGFLVEMTDGDGTTHRFVRDATPGSRWQTPPGVSLRLREVRDTTGTRAVAYEFIRPDGVVYRAENLKDKVAGLELATATWRITSITDRRGNQLDFDYGRYDTTILGAATQTVRLLAVRHNRTGTEPVATFSYDTNGRLTALTTLPGLSAPDPATGADRGWERRVEYGYDPTTGQVNEVRDNVHLPTDHPDRRVHRYSYDPDTRLLRSITDWRGGTTHFAYTPGDPGAQLNVLTDRRGKQWRWDYTAPDPVTGEQTTTASTPVAGGQSTYRTSARAPISTADPRYAGGNILAITDAGTNAGPVTTSYRWEQNQLVRSTDGAGEDTRYEYDDLGLVTQVTEPAPNTEGASFPAGAPAAPVISTITYDYNTRHSDSCPEPPPADGAVSRDGWCFAVAEMTGTVFADNLDDQQRVTSFDHDTNGNLTEVTNRARHDGQASEADRTTTFAYYERGGLRRIDGPRSDVDDVTVFGDDTDSAYGGYDRTGLATRIVDAHAKAKTFAYTPYGMTAQVVDRDQRTTASRYDDRDNLTEVTDPQGRRHAYTYDPNDNKATETSPRGTETPTAGDFTTSYTYDGNDWLTETASPGPDASTRTVVSTAYNDDGTTRAETGPLGAPSALEYEYWPNRSLRRMLVPAGTGQAKAATDYEYDTAGRTRRVLGAATNAAGNRPETITEYTPAGDVAQEQSSSAAGPMAVVRYAYNAHGEQIDTIGPRRIGDEDARSQSDYNTFGEAITSRRRLPGRWLVTEHGYDAAGNQTRTTQNTGNGAQLESLYRFDALNQLAAQTKDPVNPGHTVDYTYTGEGQQATRVDRHNNTPVRTAAYAYNPDNTQQAMVVTDHTTGATLASCNWADGQPPESGYDADGNLLISRTVAGTTGCTGGTTTRTQTLAYDHRGQVTTTTQRITLPDDNADVSRTQSFEYRGDEEVTTATHDGRATRYTYSPGGWLETATDWRDKVTTASYYPSGAAREQALGRSTATATDPAATGYFDYHADAMPSRLTWTARGGVTVRSHTNIAYDLGGLRRSEDVTVVQPLTAVATDSSGTATYDYDLLDRLTAYTSPYQHQPTDTADPTTAYALDDGGNIVEETTTVAGAQRSKIASTYTDGRLTSRQTTAAAVGGVPGSTDTDTFGYSSLGEETTRRTTSNLPGAQTRTTATSYDPAGHTSRVDEEGLGPDGDPPADVEYVYDTADRLIARTETPATGPPQTTLYFYWGTGDTLAEETDGTGATLARYLEDGDGQIIGQETHGRDPLTGNRNPADAGTWKWLLWDTAGNIATHLSDDTTPQVTEQAAFDPYGKPERGGTSTPDSQSKGSTLGFQGALTDKQTGSVVLGARQYDPTTARFTTPDTFVAGHLDMALGTDELTGNRYLFAAANPVAFYEDGHLGLPKIKIKLPKIKLPSPAKAIRSVAKKALPAVAFVPIVGTGVDLISAATGRDILNGGRKLTGAERLLMLGGAALSAIPAGTAAKAAFRATSKLKTGASVGRAAATRGDEAFNLAGAACQANSFIPGTRVLMADGTYEPIEAIDIGDEVIATDPETGETAAKAVTDLIDGHGPKQLVDITIEGETITATAGHPFWIVGRGWIDASELSHGDLLVQSDGDRQAVAAVRRYAEAGRHVHNLTVADLHTYYVVAGDESVLVHNCGGVGKRALDAAADQLFTSKTFGVESRLFGHSRAAGVPGLLNRPGSRFKVGWSGWGEMGGGMHFRLGLGRRASNANQARWHWDLRWTHIPDLRSNEVIRGARQRRGMR